MRNLHVSLLAVVCALLAVGACGKKEDPPAANAEPKPVAAHDPANPVAPGAKADKPAEPPAAGKVEPAAAPGGAVVKPAKAKGFVAGGGDAPAGDEPAGEPGEPAEPAGDEPAGDEPAGDEPAADAPAEPGEPAGDEPAGDAPAEPAGDAPAEPAEPAGDAPAEPAAPAVPAGADMMRIEYKPPAKEGYQQMEAAIKALKAFEALATAINAEIKLPRPLPVVWAQCDTVNAWYDRNAVKVTMCYDLVEFFAQNFAKLTQDEAELEAATLGATFFVFFHELGHALVHQLEIPVTGKEEDAVDQLATYILVEGGEEGVMMAVSGAHSFIGGEKQTDVEKIPFWDEHSLGEQRFYNILCWVYGSNPEAYGGIVANKMLPAERAERCPAEWAQLKTSWERLFKPHQRNPAP